MLRYTSYLLLVLSVLPVVAKAMPPDEITDAVAHAESLYYEAKFKDAIQLLQRADDMLRSKPDRLPEKITVKLQLALAHIGLNETPMAKAALRDVYVLDADYRLDAEQFPPKVIALADEAKAEQNDVRCQNVRTDARKHLEAGSAMALVNLIQTMKPKCSGLDSMEPDAADLLYKTGVDAYKAGQFSDALEKFRMAVKFSPKHELAAQYVDLTQGKLQLNTDRGLLEWRRSLEAHEFKPAAARYSQLKSSKDGPSAQMLDQMRTEYRNALSALVESSNRACASGDVATTQSIRGQLPQSLTEPSLGADILAQIKTACSDKGCLQMPSPLAMARVKAQVNPVIPPSVQDLARRAPITAHVKVRIDEKGDVTVVETQGVNTLFNNAVGKAVERWKFTPITDENGARCVDTDIPLVIKP